MASNQNSNSSLENNPFTTLFGSVRKAEEYINRVKEELSVRPSTQENAGVTVVGKNESVVSNRSSDTSKVIPSAQASETVLLEKLLLITTRQDGCREFPCLVLEDALPLTTENVDFILFERLMVDNPAAYVTGLDGKPKQNGENVDKAARCEVIVYLSEIYERCWLYKKPVNKAVETVKLAVINNLKTAIEQPAIFVNQNIDEQLKELILCRVSSSSCLSDMIMKVLQSLTAENNICYTSILEEVLSDIAKKLNECSLMGVCWDMIDVIDFYSSSPILAPFLVTPLQGSRGGSVLGRQYSSTVLGSLLSISCLPKVFGQSCEFFDKPSSQSAQIHKATEASIGTAQKALQRRIHQIFLSLLKVSPAAKDLLLKWIEDCLDANVGRAGIWHIQAEEMRSLTFVPDGFMINLCAVLIELSMPFIKDITDSSLKEHKVFKVDISYCSLAALQQKKEIEGLYCGNLPSQTAFIPKSQNLHEPKVELPGKYSFTTSCFYHAHRAHHLGLQVLYQKLNKLSQEMGRLQMQLEEISAQGSPATEMMRKHMENRMTLFLSLKAAAFESELVQGTLEFLAATCAWLIQIAVKPRDSKTTTVNAKELRLADLQEEDNSEVPHPFLQNIPEILAENIVGALTAVRRYSTDTLIFIEPLLHHFVSFIATFMGSPQWMNNPHLRANLAESLEILIPQENERTGMLGSIQGRLLTQHSLAPHLVTALLHVFVSIEMTGQSVAFEEKFNYRRPMYEVMKYLWDIPEHRQQFIQLAQFALDNMESAKTPLFLRFVNFLMNDAIFLLDEGLSYMSQIRENQNKKNSPEWSQMTAEQRAELERNTQQMSMLARFHNMLGSRTIQTLIRLTKEIPNMFTYNTLVDRMAAMLNHFLTHLVGPKQRNLKVKDMEKYEFRPSEMVSDICTIYINLSVQPSFAMAVASDGRSYTPELFKQACDVLIRIIRYDLNEAIAAFSESVKDASLRQHEDDDVAAAAPEEFLDPIMSNLMIDPVCLPSSNVIVDRQTIARHLLSDQTDPFNRQPLTMEDVIPDAELKGRIQQWVAEQKKKKMKNNI